MKKPRLQNRVDPRGALHAVADHGTLMGNRGILHDANNQIVKQWQHKSWVTCVLQFNGIKRTPFTPNNYSELFFLDEATSLAAGHRPCGYCQRPRYQLFKDAWFKSNTSNEESALRSIGALDKAMHAERALPGGGKKTYASVLADLPLGTMFESDGVIFLNWSAGHLPWSFKGYASPVKLPAATSVQVLTPLPVVRMFECGFTPMVHPTATAASGN
jgi:hypothetical protein